MVHVLRNALRAWVARRTRPTRRRPLPAAAPATAAVPDDDVPPRGCAWFDSSHDLRTGLSVDEAPPADALAQLSLGDWLQLELREWRGGLGVRA